MKSIDHVGIAVFSIEKAVVFYQKVLGFEVSPVIDIPERHVHAAMVHAGNGCLELIEPYEDNAAVRKFLKKRGEGFHHIAFHVESVENTLNAMKKAGIHPSPPGIMTGALGRKIAFLQPKDCHGILIELCESAPAHPGQASRG